MRWKIILVNGGIVLVLSLVTFFMLRTSLASVTANPQEQRGELERSLIAAGARLTLDSLVTERWLARKAESDEVRGVFEAGTPEARSDSATSVANTLRDAAVGDAAFARMAPSLVLFVDREGVGVGRNGSELMRGDKVGEVYPSLSSALSSGTTASGLWVNRDRHDQLLASYAPVRSSSGEIVGAVVLGTPLNDDRLSLTSQATSGNSLALVVGEAASPVAVGGGRQISFQSAGMGAAVAGARAGALTHVPGERAGMLFAATPLKAFGTAAVLVGAAPASKIPNVDKILWPVFAVGFLGLFLVVTGGFMLGNYVSKPISEIEEGLLLIINGQQDLRFDLEHDELGGLTSRINGLLNSVLGVPESEEEE